METRRRAMSLLILASMLLAMLPAGMPSTIISHAQPNVVIDFKYVVNATTLASSTVADGWDTLNFTLNITNQGIDKAYDVIVNNTINALDPWIWAVNITNIVAYNTSSNTILTNGTDILLIPVFNTTIPLRLDIVLLKPIPPGASIIVNYTINVSEFVATGSTYYNEANLSHYSDAPGGPNLVTTQVWSNVTVTVPPPLATSKIVKTSSVDMTGLVISGVPEPEVVTIGELVVFEINVTLPEGLTRSLEIVDWLPEELGVLLADYTGQSSVVVNDTQISSSLLGPLTPGVPVPVVGTPSGVNLVNFSLGDVLNLNNDPDTETLSLLLEVVILDDPLNTLGKVLDNEAALTYVNASGQVVCPQCSPALRVTAQVVVHEPDLILSKTFNVTPITPLSPVAQIKINLTNNATAFASPAYDVVIEDLVPDNLTVLFVTLSTSGAVNVNLHLTGNNVTVTADRLDVGGSIIVYITVSAYSGTYVNATIDNTVEANATSLPGPDPGERLYTLSSTASITYNANFGALKLVDDVIPDFQDPSLNIVAPPGAIIQYNITIAVPLGTIPVVNVTDLLDPQTTLVPGSVTVTASPGVMWDAAVLTTGPNLVNLELYNVSTAGTVGFIYITYLAQISNATSEGVLLSNLANVTTTDGILDSYTVLGSTLVAVFEPDLRESHKYFMPDPFFHTNPFTRLYINVSNNGTLPAYDVVVEDIVPNTLLVLGATVINNVGGVNPVVTVNGNNVTLTIDRLDPNGYVVVEVLVRAYALTPWNSTTTNHATINWTSLPGDVAGEKSYTTTTTDSVFYDPIVEGVKTMGPESITLGAIVTATINITIPTGNTSSLILVDQWDNGMQLVGGPFISYPPDIIVTGPITTTVVGNMVIIDFGGVANNATVPLNITVTLLLQIVYVPEYPNGTVDLVYENNATISWVDDGYLVTRNLGVSARVYMPPLLGGEAIVAPATSVATWSILAGMALLASVLLKVGRGRAK